MLAANTFTEINASAADIAVQFLPDSLAEDEYTPISEMDDIIGPCHNVSIDGMLPDGMLADGMVPDIRRSPDEFPPTYLYHPNCLGYGGDDQSYGGARRSSIVSIESVRSFTVPESHHLFDYQGPRHHPFDDMDARRASIDSRRSRRRSIDSRRMSVSSTIGSIEGLDNDGLFFPDIPRLSPAYLLNELSTLLTYKGDDCKQKENHAWKRCHYAHGEVKRRNPYLHTYAFAYCHKFCRNTRNWTCPKRDECKYAHSKEEVLYHPLRYKTIECKRFNMNSQDGRGECQNFQCAFYHDDPSPIVGNDGLKSILLMVTDLTKYYDDRARNFVLSDRERLEFFKIVTGYDEYGNDGAHGSLSDKDTPRAYLTLWLRGYFEQLTRQDPERFRSVCFEDFMLTKAEMTMEEMKKISAARH